MSGPWQPGYTPNPLLADLMAAAFREDRAGIRRVLRLLTPTERDQFARTVRIIVEEQMRQLQEAHREPLPGTVIREVSPSLIVEPASGEVIGVAPEHSIEDPFTGQVTGQMRLGDPNLRAALGQAPLGCPDGCGCGPCQWGDCGACLNQEPS